MGITIKALGAAAVLSVYAFGASAATYYFSSHITGLDMGEQNVAVLDVTQSGSDVQFSLSYSVSGQPMSAFLTAFAFTYSGAVKTNGNANGEIDEAGVTLMDLANTGSVGVSWGVNGIGNLGPDVSVNSGVQFDKGNGANADRLEVSETALFKITNVNLTDFDFSADKTAIHMQGLNGGESSKYTTGGDCANGTPGCGSGSGGIPSVPVPAGLPLLIGALGILGVSLRRSRS